MTSVARCTSLTDATRNRASEPVHSLCTNDPLYIVTLGTLTLALNEEEFRRALVRAEQIVGPPKMTTSAQAVWSEPWLDAAQIEERTGIPASWWLEAARRDDVPHIRAGKYVRFLLTEAAKALKQRGEGDGGTDVQQAHRRLNGRQNRP